MDNSVTFEKRSFVEPINELAPLNFGEVANSLALHFVGYEVVEGAAKACQWDLMQLKNFRVF